MMLHTVRSIDSPHVPSILKDSLRTIFATQHFLSIHWMACWKMTEICNEIVWFVRGVFHNFSEIISLTCIGWILEFDWLSREIEIMILSSISVWLELVLNWHITVSVAFYLWSTFSIQLKLNFWHYQWFLETFDTFNRANTAIVTSSFVTKYPRYFPFKNAKLKLKTWSNNLYIAFRVYYSISFVMWLW